MLLTLIALSTPATLASELRGSSGQGSSSGSGGDSCSSNFFSCLPKEDSLMGSCRKLDQESFQENEATELGACLRYQLQSLPSTSLAAKKQALLKLKSARLKSFIGFVVTCYGEAAKDAEPADRIAIMKVMENRTNICNKELSDQVRTPMEVALQKAQFSMYNAPIYAKNRAFEKNADDPQMKKCIEAFAKYTQLDKGKYSSNPKKTEEINFYHTPDVHPEWDKNTTQVQLTIDGKKTNDRQHFFKAGQWSCKPYAKDYGD